MVMRGIDISNWQAGLDLRKMPVDFCICKATEGINFVDGFCDNWVKQAKTLSMPYGFYHFARENDPVKEADFFIKHCKGYFGHGIPVLDYEVDNTDNVSWCEKFLKRVKDVTDVWPLIYISAYRVYQYRNSWIPDKCGLWIAGYPMHYAYWPLENDIPYSLGTWENAAIWQFTSELILPGYVGKLDGNLAYMDEKQWAKYAQSGKTSSDSTDKKENVDSLVKDVLSGKYGSGDERKIKLGNQYTTVQKRINELYNVAESVIAGKYGNGNERKKNLQKSGYPYELVQQIVNNLLNER